MKRTAFSASKAEASASARPAKSTRRPPSFRNLLVPVDFSEAGKPALRYARALARLTRASVRLIHVMEHVHAGGEFEFIRLDTSELREQICRQLGTVQMKQFQNIKTDFVIREGSPFQEIVDTARENKTDLIVMATHGYTGLRHILVGSTTERVVRHAPCPVLVVQSAEALRKNI